MAASFDTDNAALLTGDLGEPFAWAPGQDTPEEERNNGSGIFEQVVGTADGGTDQEDISPPKSNWDSPRFTLFTTEDIPLRGGVWRGEDAAFSVERRSRDAAGLWKLSLREKR